MWTNRWDFKKIKKKTCQVLQLLQESLDLLQHPVFLEGLFEEQVKDFFFFKVSTLPCPSDRLGFL